MFGNFFKSIPEITGEDLQQRLASAEPPLVVDVREPSEHAQGHIPGCTLMPLGVLGARLSELPKDRELVMVCRSGGRSAMATQQAAKAGYRATNMAGGMMAWRGPVER